MRILFITQKVDKDDDLLGVYHEWIARLAGRVNQMTVICLGRGRIELSSTVRVYSLGKEKGAVARIVYAFRFFKTLWRIHGSYDTVFVHMNEEYVLLAGLWWRLCGKQILFWRNHPNGSLRTRLAFLLAHRVFFTSPYSYAAMYAGAKGMAMPVGIDTDQFHAKEKPTHQRPSRPFTSMYIGRISPVKKVHILIEAAALLKKERAPVLIRIVGDPVPRKEDYDYQAELYLRVKELGVEDIVSFTPGVPNSRVPDLYAEADVVVNMTPSGSMDKTIFEAMACEIPVLFSNRALLLLLPAELGRECSFREGDAHSLAVRIGELSRRPLAAVRARGASLRAYVEAEHSLDLLIEKLAGMVN